jgi:hypothetical protein
MVWCVLNDFFTWRLTVTTAYTLATYKVIPGKESEFIAAWNSLAATFSALPKPPYWGTLIRSTTDSTIFHSFGPWEDLSHVTAMRSNPNASSAFQKIAAICLEMTPGNYELVTHVKVRDESTK